MSIVARPIVTLAAAGVIVATGIGAAGLASARPATNPITGGSIKVKLYPGAVKAMKKNHIALTAVSPSSLAKGTLTEQVTGGTLDIINETATVQSSGGFRIAKGSKSVTIRKLDAKTSSTGGGATAVVTGHGRIAAITTTAPVLVPGAGSITASGFTVTLSKPLVSILDKKFGTKLFKTHAKIGTGAVTFTY
jgi:hypothetical protein